MYLSSFNCDWIFLPKLGIYRVDHISHYIGADIIYLEVIDVLQDRALLSVDHIIGDAPVVWVDSETPLD